jgi:hypothetical protein
MKRTLTVAGLTVALLLPASPALAFHHVVLPDCGADIAGANPTAAGALITHNPAQTLPLPPLGTPAAPTVDDSVATPPCPGAAE